MGSEFAKAREFCYDALKSGVMPDLVLDVLDALTWAWDHTDVRINPTSCLRPLKHALSKLADESLDTRMTRRAILAALARKEITLSGAESLLVGIS